MTAAVTLDPQWTARRRVIICTLCSCLALSIYAISRDAATAQAVVNPCAILAGMVVGSYVFSAEWGRINGVPGGNVVSSSTTTTDTPDLSTTTTTRTEGAGAP